MFGIYEWNYGQRRGERGGERQIQPEFNTEMKSNGKMSIHCFKQVFRACNLRIHRIANFWLMTQFLLSSKTIWRELSLFFGCFYFYLHFSFQLLKSTCNRYHPFKWIDWRVSWNKNKCCHARGFHDNVLASLHRLYPFSILLYLCCYCCYIALEYLNIVAQILTALTK